MSHSFYVVNKEITVNRVSAYCNLAAAKFSTNISQSASISTDFSIALALLAGTYKAERSGLYSLIYTL